MRIGWTILLLLWVVSLTAQVEESAIYMEELIDRNDPAYHISSGGMELILPQFNITGFNSSFTIEDVVKSTDGVNLISLGPVLDQLNDTNSTLFQMQLNTLGLNLHTENYSIGIGHTARWLGSIQFTDELASVVTYGNAALIGNPSDIGTDLDYLYYDELNVSASLKLNRWIIGVRVKFLSGHEFIETPRSRIAVNTSHDGYVIDLDNDYRLNTYQVLEYRGLNDVDVSLDPWRFRMPFGKNQGFAFDIGVRGRLTDQIRFNASVSDIGNINWNEVTSYSSNEKISYEGIDLLDYLSEDGNVDIADSLYNLLNLVEEKTTDFSTSIPLSFTAGITNDISKSHRVGGQFSSLRYNNLSLNRMDLFWQYNLGKGYHSRLNYGIVGNSYHNFGVGIYKSSGIFRWHVNVGNIMGVIKPLDVRNAFFSIGSSVLID